VRVFVICPVRSGNRYIEVEEYVKYLEARGHTVHWPPRDTGQDDPTGYRICSDNHSAILLADEVHVAWDGESQGCLFDLGMAFAEGKKVRRIPGLFPPPTEGKSYPSMVEDWEARR